MISVRREGRTQSAIVPTEIPPGVMLKVVINSGARLAANRKKIRMPMMSSIIPITSLRVGVISEMRLRVIVCVLVVIISLPNR